MNLTAIIWLMMVVVVVVRVKEVRRKIVVMIVVLVVVGVHGAKRGQQLHGAHLGSVEGE